MEELMGVFDLGRKGGGIIRTESVKLGKGLKMGVISTVLGFSGFTIGLTTGVVIGYYLFIYFQPTDVKDPKIKPLVEYDTDSLEKMFPEMPLWVKNPDYDRIDWLNKFIETMWPYLDKAISRMAQEIANPIIAENTAKYKIDSVDFESFTLGTLPPTFQGMKVYTTEEQELIMEPSIKWAGNPNLTAIVKAYGLKASIQILDLQIFASPRITLKPLVPTFPCFAKILVSLMEKPHVDFGLKLFGADIMAIPGLYRFAQDTIKKQVASMYLWPKTLEVAILDPSKASKKPVGILHVKVIRAQNLRKKDLLGKSDPYVKLKLADDKLPSKKTQVKKSNLNPEWNEEFKITVTEPETQALQVQVFDWEQVGKHEQMGLNLVPLSSLTPQEPKTLTLNLLKTLDPSDSQNDKNRGQLIIEVTFKPFKEDNNSLLNDDISDEVAKLPEGVPAGGGLLVVCLHEANDLEGKHHTNPYAKVIFKGEENKTEVVRKNRDPRWEQEFEFLSEIPPVNDRIHVEVFSKPSKKDALFYPKESLGYVDISLSDVVANKRIMERYNLIDSKNGQIQIEMHWRAS